MFKLSDVPSEAKIKSLVRSLLFPKTKPNCLFCGKKHWMRYLRNDGRYFCGKCRKKCSLKQLAGFTGSRLTWQQIYHLIVCFYFNFPLRVSMVMSGLSYPTVRSYYRLIRQKMPNFKDIYFAGQVIADEAYLGKRRTNNQVLIMGAVSQDFTKLALEVIPDREQDSIEGFLHKHIHPISMVISDGNPAYEDITWMGYGHDCEIHEKGRFKKTVPIERIWGLLKTRIRRTYHHIHKENIEEYLSEFQSKFLTRKTIKNPQDLAKILIKPVPTS
jgi:transposase-like protein